MTIPHDIVVLRSATPGEGPQLCLRSLDSDLLERFRQTVYLSLPKQLGWFHQCSYETYHMFEMWTAQHREALLRSEAERIAAELGLKIQIDPAFG